MLRISELAERSGVPTSTLRYYERIGLVEPSGRAANGYRVYDEATVERLAFIGRAKRLGMSLDDAAGLMEAWFAGDCEPMRARLTTVVSIRIGELRRRIVEDGAFERQLERVLVRLTEAGPAPMRCAPDCGCDTDPLVLDGVGGGGGGGGLGGVGGGGGGGGLGAEAPPIGCSLGAGDAEQRVGEWHRLLATATSVGPEASGCVRAVFDLSEGLIAEIGGLCAAEVACCPFFTFNLEIAATSVVLTVHGPAGAEAMVAGLFDPGAVGTGTGLGLR